MNRLLAVVRLACLLAGVCGALLSAWAFVDPGAFPALADAGPLAPPSPRWRAAFAFVFSLALLVFGSGRVRHRSAP